MNSIENFCIANANNIANVQCEQTLSGKFATQNDFIKLKNCHEFDLCIVGATNTHGWFGLPVTSALGFQVKLDSIASFATVEEEPVTLTNLIMVVYVTQNFLSKV